MQTNYQTVELLALKRCRSHLLLWLRLFSKKLLLSWQNQARPFQRLGLLPEAICLISPCTWEDNTRRHWTETDSIWVRCSVYYLANKLQIISCITYCRLSGKSKNKATFFYCYRTTSSDTFFFLIQCTVFLPAMNNVIFWSSVLLNLMFYSIWLKSSPEIQIKF